MLNTIRTTVVVTLVFGVFAAFALMLGVEAARAAERGVPDRVTCSDEWQTPRSGEAKTCREKGWLVTSRYVVTPGRVPVYVNLPSCEYEDGSTDRLACSWNVNAGDGNGTGLRYLVLNVANNDQHGKRYVYLRECFGTRC